MECIPAIDVRNGRSVRLLRGDYAAETLYGDPLDQALAYEAGGASRLHVVDLDAARSGVGKNDEVVARIAATLSIPIEVGGGVRSLERTATLFGLGVDRVVIGTLAIEEPAVLRALAERFPGQIAVGLDHRSVTSDGVVRRELAVRGWEVGSGVDLEQFLVELESVALAAVIVTDIARDGTLEGPDLVGLEAVLCQSCHAVIASGGVGGVDDLTALKSLGSSTRGIAGVIVGKALLSGAISLAEAIATCEA
ncbi:MAG TPA: 1-(5-phosphoribosyl)-5-[(5-phosphoribosylamino)methylideneamino] imidazole-4-carboxamide isomerase [Acidimicrobiales bacterium]